MKLTAENIAAIEDLIETAATCGQRAAIIKHNVRDLPAMSMFTCVLRDIGVKMPVKNTKAFLSPEDRLAFQEFLRAKKADADAR